MRRVLNLIQLALTPHLVCINISFCCRNLQGQTSHKAIALPSAKTKKRRRNEKVLKYSNPLGAVGWGGGCCGVIKMNNLHSLAIVNGTFECACTPTAFRVLASWFISPVHCRCWGSKLHQLCLHVHPFSHWPMVRFYTDFGCPASKADTAITLLMTDRSRGCKTNFHRWNDLSVCVVVVPPMPLSHYFFRVTFWFDKKSLVERNGKSNGVPSVREGVWRRCGEGGRGSRRQLQTAPGASQQLLEEMRLLAVVTSSQVVAGSRYPLLSGFTAVASLAAVHTLRESAQYIFTLRHTFCLILTFAGPLSFTVRFWSVSLNSQLFLLFLKSLDFVPWCLSQRHSLGNFRKFPLQLWEIIWGHLSIKLCIYLHSPKWDINYSASESFVCKRSELQDEFERNCHYLAEKCW